MNRSSAKWIALSLLALAACDDAGKSVDDVAERPLTKQQHLQALFESVLDGVQLIESSEKMAKVRGAIDETTSPPRYEVTYEGCLDGFVSGSFCVQAGRHLIDVVTPEIHIIRAVDQRYVLDGFASVPEYTMVGSLDSHVAVKVDTTEHTTEVEGTATGELEVSGGVSGTVGVSLIIGGGRNYTQSAATPIIVSGTFVHEGETFAVEGGFQRE